MYYKLLFLLKKIFEYYNYCIFLLILIIKRFIFLLWIMILNINFIEIYNGTDKDINGFIYIKIYRDR